MAIKFDHTNYSQMIGLKYIEKEAEAASTGMDRQRIVTREQLPLETRVLPPGSIKTLDYRKDRMNVQLDDSDVVKKVTYG